MGFQGKNTVVLLLIASFLSVFSAEEVKPKDVVIEDGVAAKVCNVYSFYI